MRIVGRLSRKVNNSSNEVPTCPSSGSSLNRPGPVRVSQPKLSRPFITTLFWEEEGWVGSQWEEGGEVFICLCHKKPQSVVSNDHHYSIEKYKRYTHGNLLRESTRVLPTFSCPLEVGPLLLHWLSTPQSNVSLLVGKKWRFRVPWVHPTTVGGRPPKICGPIQRIPLVASSSQSFVSKSNGETVWDTLENRKDVEPKEQILYQHRVSRQTSHLFYYKGFTNRDVDCVSFRVLFFSIITL